MEIGFSLTIIAVTEAVVLILLCAAAGIMTLFGMKFRKVFLWGLLSLAVPPLAILYGHVVEINRVKVRNVEIVSERLPEAFDGYRIAQISDLHLLSFEDRHDRLAEFIDKVNSMSPDVIVFSGDLVTYSPEETAGFEDILSALNAPDGVYSVLGNHDYCIYNDDIPEDMKAAAAAEVARRQEKFGWDVLMNENVEIERISEAGDTSSIVIAGIENTSASPHFPSHGDLDAAMEGVDGRFCILASHDPTYWREALKKYPDIDLTLSGHTHAMQLSVFGISPSRLLFREYRGLYSEGGNRLYVNIGLGETAILSRIGTPPEITLIELSCDRQ